MRRRVDPVLPMYHVVPLTIQPMNDHSHDDSNHANDALAPMPSLLSERSDVCVIEIAVDGIHGCYARAVALRRALFDAEALAYQLAHSRRCIFWVGSAHRASTTVVLPVSAHPDHSASAKARVVQWLAWLRAAGVIRFGDFSDVRRHQPIPDACLIDPDVCRILDVPLRNGIGDAACDGDAFDLHWVDAAPARSIVGLLRGCGAAAQFVAWLRSLPPARVAQLAIPLFDAATADELAASGLRCALRWWHGEHGRDDIVIGIAMQCLIDHNGVARCQWMPMDRFGIDWRREHPAIAEQSVDPIYVGPSHFDLRRVLDGIDGRVRNALFDVLHAHASGTDVAPGRRRAPRNIRFDDGYRPFVDAMTAIVIVGIEAEIAALRADVLANVFPFDGTATTLTMNHYLFAEGDAIRQLRRRQARQAFPLLATLCAGGRLPTMTATIDAARPLRRAFAEAVQIPRWVAQRVRAATGAVARLNGCGLKPLIEICNLLTTLGPHAPVPDLPTMTILRATLKVFADDDIVRPWRWRELLLRAAGREAMLCGWHVAMRHCQRLGADADLRRLIVHYLRDAHENVAWILSRCLGASITDETPSPDQIVSRWFADVPLSRIIGDSRAWKHLLDVATGPSDDHRASGTATDAAHANAGAIPPLFGTFSCVATRIVVRPLLTADELCDESAHMHHCVKSYIRQVALRNTLIVSLIDSSTTPSTDARATAEYHLATNGTWRRQQLSGCGNARIPASSRLGKTAHRLKQWLNECAWQIPAAAIEPYATASARQKLLAQCGPATDDECLHNGSLIIDRLPEALRRAAAALLPGKGVLEARVMRATERVACS